MNVSSSVLVVTLTHQWVYTKQAFADVAMNILDLNALLVGT